MAVQQSTKPNRQISISAKIAAGIGISCFLATMAGFLTGSALTVFPALGFVLTVVYGWVVHQAQTAKALAFLMTIIVVVVLTLTTIYLFIGSLPVVQRMGVGLLTRTTNPMWDPNQNIYSLVPMVWGTIVTTLIAVVVAGPFGIAGAIFISEVAPPYARGVLKAGVELLAGIPTIVYAFIGFAIIDPYLMQYLQLTTSGSLFVVGALIGLIALPTVVSVADDALSSVPDSIKTGALSLGATKWQTITSVTLPAAISGVTAAVLLGVGRALGETMVAVVILANIEALPQPLYDLFGNTITLTSLIASQYGSAGGTQLSALFAAGLLLFVTVLILSITSLIIETRMERKLGGNQ